jgi:predicted TIM-barrel fold metal-dependent hydrolase
MRVDIEAIDVHGHYGSCEQDASDFNRLLMSGDAALVVRRARAVNIRWTVVSPLLGLMPRGHTDAVAGNNEAARVVAETDGLLQWVILDPRSPATYRQAEEMLPRPWCVGLKFHPEEHGYPIAEQGRALFEFAARHRAVVLGHSSERNSLCADYVRWADEFPEVRLILAHIGCGWDNDMTHQIRGIQASRHGNVYADTSSARSITSGLIECAVREVGAEKVLFGTDSPLYSTAMQRARIDHAELTDREKRLILRDNAERLLQLGSRQLAK